MARTLLTDEQWHKLKVILLQLGIYNKHGLRNTVEGILFRIRTGIPWEDLPCEFGNCAIAFIVLFLDGQNQASQ